MAISTVAANHAASVLTSTNTTNASESTTAATFQSSMEKAKTKLSLMDFYLHGDKSRLTDDENTELKQAVDFENQINKGDTSFSDSKSYQTKYDLDHDGVVTTEEIDTHITELENTRSSDFIGVNQELHFGLLLKSHYTGGSAMFRPEDIHTEEGSQKSVAQRRGALLANSGGMTTIYSTILSKYSDLFF